MIVYHFRCVLRPVFQPPASRGAESSSPAKPSAQKLALENYGFNPRGNHHSKYGYILHDITLQQTNVAMEDHLVK